VFSPLRSSGNSPGIGDRKIGYGVDDQVAHVGVIRLTAIEPGSESDIPISVQPVIQIETGIDEPVLGVVETVPLQRD
jgi:hypothetical protein